MISVCIPTKNAGSEFACNLGAWQDQQLDEPLELVIVDSGSSDQIVSIAGDLGARVFTIPSNEFNHGETRNLLARCARGDILVFTVQDAWPARDFTLKELTEPLRRDAQLAGVTGRQVPRPDADLFARLEVEGHNSIVDKGLQKKVINSLEDFQRYDFSTRLRYLAFDNVCSAVRRSVWEKFPFARIDFGEDLDWAFRVLSAGGSTLFNPEATVFHSHNYPPYQRLKRHFVGMRALSRIFRMAPEFRTLPDEQILEGIATFLADLANLHESLSCSRIPIRSLELPGPPRGPVQEQLQRGYNHQAIFLCKFFGPLSAPLAAEAVIQIGCGQLGSLLGRYYYSCQQEGKVPDWLEEMGINLSRRI